MSAVAADELLDIVSAKALAEIYQHAEQEYPRECCGMILADGTVRPCVNAQDSMQAIDSVTFDRNARRAFTFDAADQLFLARSFESSRPVRVIYHSHPTGGVHFSRYDRAGASIDGRPIYPELLHIVVDCTGGVAREAVLYRFDSQEPTKLAAY